MSGGGAIEQLERAAQLLDRGLLTRDEFSQLKAHVLSTHCTDAPVAVAGQCVSKRELAADDDDEWACAGSSRSAKRPALDDGLQALVKGATHAARGWWRHVDIFSMSIAPFLHDDLGAALRCRAVCQRWKSAVRMAGLEPLEAGLPLEARERGVWEQKRLLALRRREEAVWADEEHKRNFEKLSNDLQQQHGLNGKMRQILVDWLLELHWNTFENYATHSYVVHLAVQLVDRYIAIKQVQRSNFQAVGAVAFGITCASIECKGLTFTDRHCKIAHSIQTNDLRVTKEYLIYMCAHAFSSRDFERIENDMLCTLRQGPVIPSAVTASPAAQPVAAGPGGASRDVCALTVAAHPRPADFLARFAKAAGFEPIESLVTAASAFTSTRVLIFCLDVVLVSLFSFAFCAQCPRHARGVFSTVARQYNLCSLHCIMIKSHFCKYRASEQLAGCIMSTMRMCPQKASAQNSSVMHAHRDWNPQLAYYTGFSRSAVAVIADKIVEEAVDVSEKIMKIMTGFNVDPASMSRIDLHVGSFRKRYDEAFLTRVHDILQGIVGKQAASASDSAGNGRADASRQLAGQSPAPAAVEGSVAGGAGVVGVAGGGSASAGAPAGASAAHSDNSH